MPNTTVKTSRIVPPALMAWAAVACVALSIPAAITLGTADITITEVTQVLRSAITGQPATDVASGTIHIVWDLRLPRVLLAATVGAGLALLGGLMQTLVRNPLADPYILGISSGASVGAAAVILFNVFSLRTVFGAQAVSIAGFTGALIATLVVYLLSRTDSGLSPHRLILGGVALGFMFSAITSLLIFLGMPHAAGSVLFWILGGLGRAAWNTLAIPVVLCVAVSVYAIGRSGWLNALAMGDDVATSLGVPVTRFRAELFFASALLTGVFVAISGAIGFVGLILPHFARLLVGSDHRRMLFVAMPLGALFLIWADVFARTIAAPQVLPVGVITALVGGPVFIILLIGKTRSMR